MLQAIYDRVLYRTGYFRMVDATSARSAEPMAESIVGAFSPSRVIDYGCGTGSLLLAIRSRGVAVAGTEYSQLARRYCQKKGLDPLPLDLRDPPVVPPLGKSDVAMSFEVAEHLPQAVATDFVRLLSATAPAVVFGAATPGQGGQGHINEQPHEYWISRFSERGFVWDEALSLGFRESWRAAGVDFWYADNAMVFRQPPACHEG